MKSHYRRTTPYYDLVMLTSPARIESLAVDPSGNGRHLGVVNNFGRMGSTVFASYGSPSHVEPNTVVAGCPANVEDDVEQLRLERLPVGEHGLFATWSFSFGEKTFDMAIEWLVERPQHDIWELGWKLDATSRHVGDLASADLSSIELREFRDATQQCLLWWDDDPRYSHTLVSALLPDSVDRGDVVRVDVPSDRPASSGLWCTVAEPGGATLEAGRIRGGRWRFGASGRPADSAYAVSLVGEASGGEPACPSPGTPRHGFQRAAAVQFGERLAATDTVAPVATGPDGSWLLSDGDVMAAFVPSGDYWDCWLYLRSRTTWQLAATSAPHVCFTTVRPDNMGGLLVQGELRGLDDRVETTTEQVWALRRDMDVSDDAGVSGVVQIRATDIPIADHTDDASGDHCAHPMHGFLAYPGGLSKDNIDKYDVLSSPVLRPQADLIVGQRALWSPSVHVQHESTSIALIPDLLEHRKPGNHAAMPPSGYFGLALDLDTANRALDAPLLSFGWRSVAGIYGYYFRDVGTRPKQTTCLAYDLVLRADAPHRSVTSDVQRRLWAHVGRRYATQSTLPQTQPADAAFDEAWSFWRSHYDFTEVDGRAVGAVRVDRALEPGINFMSWFNSLRTAYGLFTYGRDRSDNDLLAKARSTLELLLSAPRESGAFPTIADIRGDRITWQTSHRNFLDQMPWGPTSYHTFDMGWAAYWLLRWHQDLESQPRAVSFAAEYGEFLLRQLLPSGAVPSWVHQATLEANAHLLESAQTASSVMLLAELARVTQRADFLDAAKHSARYIVRQHLDQDRWDDFEPYYSNTLKSEGAADPFTGQHTQNTLSMHFAAVGLLTLYELTGERQWLGDGLRAVDSFLRYQYVTPGIGLSMNCFGGFAVQNTDNEALDARQSQFAVTLLDYARVTARAEFAERGIAALRAGYATMASPSAELINPEYFDAHPTGSGPENYAHATFDGQAEYTHFDWGQGSAAAGFAEARNRFGDVWIDAERRFAFGIDNVAVDNWHLTDGDIFLELTSPAADHTVLLKVTGITSAKIRLHINDGPVRILARDDLIAGVAVPTRQRTRIVHNPRRARPPMAGRAFRVTASITSGDPIVEAKVHYRRDNGTWRDVAMHGDHNEWIGVVPGDASAPGRALYYYISARTDRETRTTPEVDPEREPFMSGIANRVSG